MTHTVTVTCTSLDKIVWDPPGTGDLAEGTVHVWRASLRQQKAALEKYFQELSPEEKKGASRFFRTEDRNRFLLGRKMLRTLISLAIAIPPETVAIQTDSNGKPYFISKDERPLFFNLSHSGNWVLIAIGLSASGVDVEAINQAIEVEELSAACFSAEEQQALQKASDPLPAFYTFWTRKEALLKATGIGLINELSHFSCLNGFNSVTANIIRSNKDWNIQSFRLDEGHFASVATVPGTVCRFYNFNFLCPCVY
ncbi:MAG TPA: 4'-phosphopantetheinyl transferase superfamily protein [Flavisolibacter sp.]|jgi:4'-phosphopantetheinyl transferase|nr:4'-phosphopantetheinyl transferase superfamily protein [Flavisolibacter sp.]